MPGNVHGEWEGKVNECRYFFEVVVYLPEFVLVLFAFLSSGTDNGEKEIGCLGFVFVNDGLYAWFHFDEKLLVGFSTAV